MHDTATFDPTQLSTQALHGYLLAAVGPRPIALASTIDNHGKINLSPFSFFNVFSANPPVMIFSPARRGKDNSTKHTYENVLEVPEVVINIVNHAMVEQISLASSDFPKEINEFQKAGLTEITSEKVRPPRVGESPVSFECAVQEVVALGSKGGAGNLVISEVKLLHIHSQYLDAQGKLDTTKLDLVGRMGGNWYTRASGKSLFQVEKPASPLGVGIDQLPESIRNSTMLSGNHKAKLGNLPALPDHQEIQDWRNSPENMALYHRADPLEQLQLAKQMIEKDDVRQALLLLMAGKSL